MGVHRSLMSGTRETLDADDHRLLLPKTSRAGAGQAVNQCAEGAEEGISSHVGTLSRNSDPPNRRGQECYILDGSPQQPETSVRCKEHPTLQIGFL